MSQTVPIDQAHPSPARSRHYSQLDALRGLAAFAVVLTHFARLWDSFSPLAGLFVYRIFLPFFNGAASVTLFFLLSGFVLSLPYKAHNQLPYRIFLLRRLARIYLPYLAALALALLGDRLLHQPIAVSRWFSETWTAPLDSRLILQNILLIGNADTTQVNTAFWSLAVEMRLSILFPILCLPLLRLKPRLVAPLCAAFVLLNYAEVHFLTHRLDPISFSNLSNTIAGLLSFVAGILLARRLEAVQTRWGSMSAAARAVFAFLSFVCLEWSATLSGGHL